MSKEGESFIAFQREFSTHSTHDTVRAFFQYAPWLPAAFQIALRQTRHLGPLCNLVLGKPKGKQVRNLTDLL